MADARGRVIVVVVHVHDHIAARGIGQLVALAADRLGFGLAQVAQAADAPEEILDRVGAVVEHDQLHPIERIVLLAIAAKQLGDEVATIPRRHDHADERGHGS